MYSLINYINKNFNLNNSCFDFYLTELFMYISLFEIFNFIILCLILFSIFIRFLIIRYTFKKVILFIIKRLIFSFLFFGLFTFFSSPIYCANPISKLFDTNTKKVCITTFAIMGCYLSYKYVPIYYKTVISHNNYIESLKKKELYNIQIKEYSIYLEYLDSRKNNIINFNNNVHLFETFINQFFQNFKEFLKDNKFTNFFNHQNIGSYNRFLYNVKYDMDNSPGNFSDNIYNSNEYHDKLKIIYDNIINSSNIANEFCDSNKSIRYKINKSFCDNQTNCFVDLENLIIFYNQTLIPTLADLTVNNVLQVNSQNLFIYYKLIINIEVLLRKSVNSSTLMFDNYNSLKTLVVLSEPLDYITPKISEYKKPINLDSINFPLENLEGLRYIGINVGYIVFYPILYTSNKILGTINPLSNKAFTEAIAYLISIIKFF